jgi:release factor glutamine methyltransferase
MLDAAHAAGPTLRATLRQATAVLRRAGVDGAGNDARRLLAAALGSSPVELLSRPERTLSCDEAERFDRCIARRIAREPVSRILGARDFYGRSFAISPATLDPRPDSETLIEAALELVRSEGRETQPLGILDVGTGSGCLLLTLLCELPLATGVGTDISAAALEVARRNAGRLGVAARSRWLAADVLEGVRGEFDILVCNPPYIPTGEIAALEREVRDFDPVAALDGGEDGLRFFHRLAAKIPGVIPDGWIVLEVGHDQADAVAGMLVSSIPGIDPGNIGVFRDTNGRRRCVAARALR